MFLFNKTKREGRGDQINDIENGDYSSDESSEVSECNLVASIDLPDLSPPDNWDYNKLTCI